MRSPPETPYLFALESAMDELAYALNMDPVELRRINDTKNEPIKGLPYHQPVADAMFRCRRARLSAGPSAIPSRAPCATATG